MLFQTKKSQIRDILKIRDFENADVDADDVRDKHDVHLTIDDSQQNVAAKSDDVNSDARLTIQRRDDSVNDVRKLTPPASERKKMMTNLIKRPPVDIRYENLVNNIIAKVKSSPNFSCNTVNRYGNKK